MAKDSYFRKHRERLEEAGEQFAEKKVVINISDEKRKEFEEGRVLLLDKPLHWTSFDVVRKIRNSMHSSNIQQ